MQTVAVKASDRSAPPKVSDALVLRIQNVFDAARRVRDLRAGLKTYDQMHAERRAALLEQIHRAEAEMVSAENALVAMDAEAQRAQAVRS